MIKTIKAKEGLKVGDSYMNNDLREQVKLRIPVYKSKKYGEAPVLTDKMIDELITLIRTATLDEISNAERNLLCRYGKHTVKTGHVYYSAMEFKQLIDNLRGKSDDT